MTEKNVNVKGHIRKTKKGAYFVKNYSRKDEITQKKVLTSNRINNNNETKPESKPGLSNTQKLIIGGATLAGGGLLTLGAIKGYKTLKSIKVAKQRPSAYTGVPKEIPIDGEDVAETVVKAAKPEIVVPKKIEISSDDVVTVPSKSSKGDIDIDWEEPSVISKSNSTLPSLNKSVASASNNSQALEAIDNIKKQGKHGKALNQVYGLVAQADDLTDDEISTARDIFYGSLKRSGKSSKNQINWAKDFESALGKKQTEFKPLPSVKTETALPSVKKKVIKYDTPAERVANKQARFVYKLGRTAEQQYQPFEIIKELENEYKNNRMTKAAYDLAFKQLQKHLKNNNIDL